MRMKKLVKINYYFSAQIKVNNLISAVDNAVYFSLEVPIIWELWGVWVCDTNKGRVVELSCRVVVLAFNNLLLTTETFLWFLCGVFSREFPYEQKAHTH